MPIQPEQIKGAGVMFVTPQNEVLFLLRSSNSNNPNMWDLPGGKAEDGETAEQTAIRESTEEISATPYGELSEIANTTSINDTENVGFITFRQFIRHKFVPVLDPQEHSDYRWATLEDAPEPLHPGVREVVDIALGVTGKVAQDAEFKEEDHPRAENGQFGSGGGGAESKQSSNTKEQYVENFFNKFSDEEKQVDVIGRQTTDKLLELQGDFVSSESKNGNVAKFSELIKNELNIRKKEKEANKERMNPVDRGAEASLSDKQIESVIAYTNGFEKQYKQINQALRTGQEQKSFNSKTIDGLDSIFANAKTTKPITVYRGVPQDVAKQLSTGTIYKDNAFLSTTSDASFAESWAGDESVLMEIDLPIGSPAVSLEEYSQIPNEHEILLNRGLSYKVTGESMKNGQRVLKMEAIIE